MDFGSGTFVVSEQGNQPRFGIVSCRNALSTRPCSFYIDKIHIWSIRLATK